MPWKIPKKISLLSVAILFLFTFFNLILDAPRICIILREVGFKYLVKGNYDPVLSKFTSYKLSAYAYSRKIRKWLRYSLTFEDMFVEKFSI